ncbi:unnamed protein product [Paramecium octaurelia]|uniref:Uncharacterized protein n=1 Tax=Paramecium octaurelia TaxID=43137 RepID=A0A8S1TST3_PAROT|nr:unnamed protein product [Paramecium octaurelia]
MKSYVNIIFLVIINRTSSIFIIFKLKVFSILFNQVIYNIQILLSHLESIINNSSYQLLIINKIKIYNYHVFPSTLIREIVSNQRIQKQAIERSVQSSHFIWSIKISSNYIQTQEGMIIHLFYKISKKSLLKIQTFSAFRF